MRLIVVVFMGLIGARADRGSKPRPYVYDSLIHYPLTGSNERKRSLQETPAEGIPQQVDALYQGYGKKQLRRLDRD